MSHFSSVLVANRGEIARRIFRTARTMGLRCVAVYVDADTQAPFVRDADTAVRIVTSYLDAEAIIEAALISGAQAVHPGYGFLSENAEFARKVTAAGLVWIGPAPSAIEMMGDKLQAKRVAQEAGVSTLPSSSDPTDAAAVGYPLLVKAAMGGGGKGMRIVRSADDLAEAVEGARREAGNSFGDDTVFLERYVPNARHIEVQLLGDAHGSLVHLGERECSIQRRHQKIIEESPSTAVDETLRAAMTDAALRLARAIAYESAGTVEFLLDDTTGEFFFLETNTRLQVEHAVTEEVTGIDLVREQFRIAAGEELGYDQADVATTGHAIEVRLYAEDPANDFLPATGVIEAYMPAAEPRVRWDSGIETGSVVGVEFDPMLAKVVAHAPTRTEAAGRLALALERLHLGGVTTNRDFLVASLRTREFLAGETTTDFIDRVGPAPALVLSTIELRNAATIGALWLQGYNRAHVSVLASLPSGFRVSRMPAQSVVLNHRGQRAEVTYQRRRDGTFTLADGVATVHEWSASGIDIEIEGVRSCARITRADDSLHVQVAAGTVSFAICPRFELPGQSESSGGLVAPMPGIVLEIRCKPGDAVTGGQTLIVLEAMKMEHRITAPTDGVVAEVRVVEGGQVVNGEVLIVFETNDSPGSAEGE